MKKTTLIMGALWLAMLFVPTAMQAQEKPLAFPGAEGFGRYATGGRGGQIYHVTNLNDDGPGSLRDAVSQPNRIVVFDVSGVIRLKSLLTFQGNLTVLGQTAPGEGIQVYGNRVSFSGANNLIVRYMRFRQGKLGSSQVDACGIANGANMIFDHLSVFWGTDECFSINADGKGTPPANITIQNSIIGQGLQPHSAGGLIQPDGGVTLYRNLYIDNNTRNPKVKGLNQFVNNVVYNWGNGGCYLMGGESSGPSWADIESNYFICGPWKKSSPLSSGNEMFQFYGRDNMLDNNVDGVLNGEEFTGDGGGKRVADLNSFTDLPEAHPAIANKMSAEDALKWIIDSVGASLPARDEVDLFAIEELTSYGTKGTANGYSDERQMPHKGTGILNGGKKPLDTDNDGIPDEWEDAHGLDKNDVSDAAKIVNGYANIENYVNTITAPYPYHKAPSNLTASDQKKTTVTLTWVDNAGSKPGDINEAGYIIEMSEDNETFTEAGRVESDATTYTKEGLTPEKNYWWRVTAYTTDETLTATSSVLLAETAGEPTMPEKATAPKPEIGTSIGTAAHAIEFSWENASKEYYSPVTYTLYFGESEETLKEIATDLSVKSYKYEQDLEPATYYWRVNAKNNEGVTQGDVWSFNLYEGGTLFYTDFETTPAEWAEQVGSYRVDFTESTTIGGITLGVLTRIVAMGPMGLDPNSSADAGATRCCVAFPSKNKSHSYLEFPEVEGPCTITIWAASGSSKVKSTFKLNTIVDGTETTATSFTTTDKKIFKFSYRYLEEGKVKFKIDSNNSDLLISDVLIEQYVPVDENMPLTLVTPPTTTKGISYMDGVSLSYTFNQDIEYHGGVILSPKKWEEVSASVSEKTLTLTFNALDINTEYTVSFPEGALTDVTGTKSFTTAQTFSTCDFGPNIDSNNSHWNHAATDQPLDFKPFNAISPFTRQDGTSQTKANDHPHWIQVGSTTETTATFTKGSGAKDDHKIMCYFANTSAAIEVAADYEGSGTVNFKIQETRNADVTPSWRTIRILHADDFPFHEVLPLNPESRFIKLTATSLGGGKVKVSELKIANAEGNGINKPEVKKDFNPTVTPDSTETLYYLKEFILSFEKTTKLQPDSTATIISDTDTLPASITKRGNDVFAITLSDTLFTVGEYTLTIPEGTVGDPTYIDDPTTGHCNPALSYTYTITEKPAVQKDLIPTVTPDSTETLYYLKEFILSFENTVKLRDSTATITNGTDDQMVIITEGENNVFAITLSDTLFTAGEYTLTIPEGTFGDSIYIDDPTTGHCNPALSYTYTIKEVDALDENIADNMVVTVADGTVTVSGVPAGEQVDVIDLSGRIIASQKAADGKATFSLQRGFYLLKTATRTFKVSL